VINSMNPLVSNANGVDPSQLVEQLARRVDTNRDGQVTSTEFSAFLSNLMQSLDTEQAAQQERGDRPQAAGSGDALPVMLSLQDAGSLTRAQGAALLRQAFETVSRSR